MKSERRHALQNNTLASGIGNAGDIARRHGSKILLGVILIALVGVLIYFRSNAASQSRQTALIRVHNARQAILELQSQPRAFEQKALAASWRDSYDRGNVALANYTELTDDPAILAEFVLATGDLDWQAANLPVMPGAATQPALVVIANPDQLIKEAESAYETILHDYSAFPMVVIKARFGLAAIAENRGDLAAARLQYDAIAAAPGVNPAFLQHAKLMIDRLPSIEHTLLLVVEEPATLPSSTSTSQPATNASTQPATGPTTRSPLSL